MCNFKVEVSSNMLDCKQYFMVYILNIHFTPLYYQFNPTEPCDAGFFKIGGSGECALCEENSWSKAGADYCNACPFGMVSNAGSTSADDCRFGEQSIL